MAENAVFGIVFYRLLKRLGKLHLKLACGSRCKGYAEDILYADRVFLVRQGANDTLGEGRRFTGACRRGNKQGLLPLFYRG